MADEFNDLKADAAHFAGEEDFLRGTCEAFGVADFRDIYIAEAKLPMLRHIAQATGYDMYTESGLAAIDRIVALRPDAFKFALAYKQMELIYSRFDNGPGSMTHDKAAQYRQLYNLEQAAFGNSGRGDAAIQSEVTSTKMTL